jgi:hypothetical protein
MELRWMYPLSIQQTTDLIVSNLPNRTRFRKSRCEETNTWLIPIFMLD